MLERIEADAAETPSRVIAAQPRDVSVRRFVERDSNDQGDDPGRDSIGRAAELSKHSRLLLVASATNPLDWLSSRIQKTEMHVRAVTDCVKIARVNVSPTPSTPFPRTVTASPAARCLPSMGASTGAAHIRAGGIPAFQRVEG